MNSEAVPFRELTVEMPGGFGRSEHYPTAHILELEQMTAKVKPNVTSDDRIRTCSNQSSGVPSGWGILRRLPPPLAPDRLQRKPHRERASAPRTSPRRNVARLIKRPCTARPQTD
jgi:hypothetical protein